MESQKYAIFPPWFGFIPSFDDLLLQMERDVVAESSNTLVGPSAVKSFKLCYSIFTGFKPIECVGSIFNEPMPYCIVMS